MVSVVLLLGAGPLVVLGCCAVSPFSWACSSSTYLVVCSWKLAAGACMPFVTACWLRPFLLSCLVPGFDRGTILFVLRSSLPACAFCPPLRRWVPCASVVLLSWPHVSYALELLCLFCLPLSSVALCALCRCARPAMMSSVLPLTFPGIASFFLFFAVDSLPSFPKRGTCTDAPRISAR